MKKLTTEKSCANCAHFTTTPNTRGIIKNNICYLHNKVIETPLFYYCKDLTPINTQNDPIKPDHYKQGKLTCKEVCETMCANKVGIEAAHVFNITKYIYRYNMKDGIKDVRKAREYCDFLIAHLEEKENE